jgi:hypothetical protein
MIDAALALKIAVPPALVVVMTLTARWFGPTVGALVMGLPWMTGPVLFFLARDRGIDYAVAACTGIALGVVAIAAFALAWGHAARWFSVCVALPLAVVVMAATAMLVQSLSVDLATAALLGTGSLVASWQLLPRPAAPVIAPPPPHLDIPLRMGATFVLVAVIMLSADRLGPRLSGVLATFPVLLTVIGAFTHAATGADGILRVLGGIARSLIGFVAFFFAVGTALPRIGLVAAYMAGAAVAFAFTASPIAFDQWRALK